MEDEVLAGLVPTPAQQTQMAKVVAALESRCDAELAAHGWAGKAQVQGSVAKDTWIAGAADLDCFLLMDPKLDEATLKTVAEKIGDAVLDNPQRKYAEHPYLLGTFQGAQVDLVPAYAVIQAGDKMSAVDRTPFHTAWVRENLDPGARDQVRLLKQWCKGVGIYGAETAIGGFSGYLLEVLVSALGGWRSVLQWFMADCKPRRIAIGPDKVADKVSPLVVVDPVDTTRNCAAAVQADMIALAADAATAYAAAPSKQFFHPPPAKAQPAGSLAKALTSQNAAWIALIAAPATDRLDIVFPQFQKAARSISAGLERAGFQVNRATVASIDADHVGLQWLCSDDVLPATRIHRGPHASKSANAKKFQEKWQNHPDALGEPQVFDDHWQVEVVIRQRTPAAWLQANLPGLSLGKHVAAAIAANPHILTSPADLPDVWAPQVGEFVLGQRPWQR